MVTTRGGWDRDLVSREAGDAAKQPTGHPPLPENDPVQTITRTVLEKPLLRERAAAHFQRRMAGGKPWRRGCPVWIADQLCWSRSLRCSRESAQRCTDALPRKLAPSGHQAQGNEKNSIKVVLLGLCYFSLLPFDLYPMII